MKQLIMLDSHGLIDPSEHSWRFSLSSHMKSFYPKLDWYEPNNRKMYWQNCFWVVLVVMHWDSSLSNFWSSWYLLDTNYRFRSRIYATPCVKMFLLWSTIMQLLRKNYCGPQFQIIIFYVIEKCNLKTLMSW